MNIFIITPALTIAPAEASLVPRLLDSFLSHTVQKRGESLDDLITCTMTYYAWFYVRFL